MRCLEDVSQRWLVRLFLERVVVDDLQDKINVEYGRNEFKQADWRFPVKFTETFGKFNEIVLREEDLEMLDFKCGDELDDVFFGEDN